MIHQQLPRHRTERGVFVPGMLGAGLLVSTGLLLSDAFAKLRGQDAASRAAHRRAALIARDVLRPTAAATPPAPPTALRRPGVYWVIGIAGIALGVYGLIGSFWNFWNASPDLQWSEHIAWLWAVLTIAALAMIALGIACVMLARQREGAPAALLPLLLTTPLGRRAPRGSAPEAGR